MRFTPFALSLLAVAVCLQAQAETVSKADTAKPAAIELDANIVTASRTRSSIADIAGSVQSIPREQIEQQAAAGRKVADILAQLVPSLGVSSGTTSNYGQTMRGRQIQVMINGVPHSGSRDVARQLNSVSPASIERIEVLSGATSLYGAGATGGIINIVTKGNQGEALGFNSGVGVTAGGKHISSDGLAYDLSQSLSFATENVDGYLGANFTQRGAHFDADGDRIAPEPAQTDRHDTETMDLNGRLNFQLTDSQSLRFAAQYYNDEQDSDYAPDYGQNLSYLFNPKLDPSLDAVHGLQLDEQPFTERYNLSATYQNDDVFGQSLTAEAYYRKETARFFPFASYIGTSRAQQFVSALPISNAQKQGLLRNAYAVLQSESEVDVLGLMTAMQSNFDVLDKPVELTYGVDLQREKNSQTADAIRLNSFISSNGTSYQPTGKNYAFGPDVELKTAGIFTQSSTQITEQLAIKAGVRFEQIKSSSSAFTPTSESLFADYMAPYNLSYATADIASGDVKHHATLFNLGAVYDLDASQQLFANYSQGFSLPDMQRTLRDVQPGFVVKSENVDPITVDSFEAGWRTQIGDTGSANITGFYNTSDKVVQFQRDFSVNVADTDERFYGAEAALTLPLSAHWSAGGSLAYTRGQFKDSSGTWRELNAYRATPLKSTLFGEWNNLTGQSVRLQMLAIGGSDRAYDDSLKATYDSNVRATTAAKIQGYAVLDLIAQTELPQGKVNVGVYNVLNREYQTVYSQEAEATYGKMSGIPAEGRTVAMSYSIDY